MSTDKLTRIDDEAGALGAEVGLEGMPRVLRDLADGRLDSTEVDAVVDWLQASAAEEPEPWVVNRAVRIGRQAPRGGRPRIGLLRQVAATRVYDSRLAPRPRGARAYAAEQVRLMYQAGGIEIDLEVTPSSINGRLRLLGQVTAEPSDLVEAWVTVEGRDGRHKTTVDELGQFTLDGLCPGEYRMEVGLHYDLIEIPGVQI